MKLFTGLQDFLGLYEAPLQSSGPSSTPHLPNVTAPSSNASISNNSATASAQQQFKKRSAASLNREGIEIFAIIFDQNVF